MTHEELVTLIEDAIEGEDVGDDELSLLVDHVFGECEECRGLRDPVNDPERDDHSDGVWRMAVGLWLTLKGSGHEPSILPLLVKNLKNLAE